MVDSVEDCVMLPEKVLSPKKILVITFVTATFNATRGQYKYIHLADVSRNFFIAFTMRPERKVWETLA